MMRPPTLALAVALGATALGPLPAMAQEADAAATEAAQADAGMSQGGTGTLVNAEGAQLGNASVSITASGQTLIALQAEGLPEGTHGVHVHKVGACDGPAFETAGEHVGAGEQEHGIMAASGPHPGDLPNAHAGADGAVTYEAFAAELTGDMLFDDDGSALIVHADPDDYTTQPSGDSGDRIACAVIEPGGDLAPGATDDGTDPVDAAEGDASGG